MRSRSELGHPAPRAAQASKGRALQVVKRQRGLLQVLHRRAPVFLKLAQHLVAERRGRILARALRVLPARASGPHSPWQP